MGLQISESKPPIPTKVVDTGGRVIAQGDDVMDGQRVWQSIGGQQIGSVWGHGAYVAPDWTADWLHREAVFVLDEYARDAGVASYDAASPEVRGALEARLR